MPDQITSVLAALKERWPSAYVARTKVGEFTGGLVSPGTVANADSKGEGPEGAIRMGRNTGYPVDGFLRWLQKRVVFRKSDMGKVRAARKRRQM